MRSKLKYPWSLASARARKANLFHTYKMTAPESSGAVFRFNCRDGRWRGADLNCRPWAYESPALPTELPRQISYAGRAETKDSYLLGFRFVVRSRSRTDYSREAIGRNAIWLRSLCSASTCSTSLNRLGDAPFRRVKLTPTSFRSGIWRVLSTSAMQSVFGQA